MMLAIIMTCALMAGCGDAKLTTQTVQGTKTAIQIDLPFTLENQLKEEQIPQMAYIQSLSESTTTKAKGMDFHLAQFMTFQLDADKFAAAGAEVQQAFPQKAANFYLKLFEKHAQISEMNRDVKDVTIDGHAAKIYTITCKMKGEDENFKLLALPLDGEIWFVNFAYPKEHEDDRGKLAEKILQSVKVQQ